MSDESDPPMTEWRPRRRMMDSTGTDGPTPPRISTGKRRLHLSGREGSSSIARPQCHALSAAPASGERGLAIPAVFTGGGLGEGNE